MSHRIQFTISDSEKLELEKIAKKEGYPNNADLAKERTLNHPLSILDLCQTALKNRKKSLGK